MFSQQVLQRWLIAYLACIPCIASLLEAQEVLENRYLIQIAASNVQAAIGAPGINSLGNNGSMLVDFAALERGSMVAAMSSAEPQIIQADAQKISNDCAAIRAKLGNLAYCEPDFVYKASASSNDPQLSKLWGMSRIDAPAAWDLSTGSSRVVAVIDTGIDYSHPDLAGNMWTNPGEIPNNGRDDDGNGYVDDVYGWNAFSDNGDPYDDNGHGTHVAGTIAAVGNNGLGVAGLNWKSKLMALKFLSGNGSGSLSGAIRAINYMVKMKQRGVDIVVSNNSWGGGGFSQALHDAISRANDVGIVFVAAAGNESNDNDANPSYPSNFDLPNIVSVAAIDNDGNLAYFSNYGAQSVDIAAPGVSILSTYPGNQYASLSGTSMATPHVSAAIALLMGSDTSLSVSQSIQRILDSGIPSVALSNLVSTSRELNAYRALANLVVPLPIATPAPANCTYLVEEISESADTSADPGSAADLIMSNTDEFGFTPITLNSSFVYDNSSIQKIVISPNMLAYLGSDPSQMDYVNKAAVPANSVGAQSDVVSNVRAIQQEGSLLVTWESSAYGKAELGSVYMTLKFEESGIIKQWMRFSSSEIQRLIASRATVGLHGRGTNVATYARNSNKIRDGLALKYTPYCDPSSIPTSIHKVRLSALNPSKKSLSSIRDKFSLNVDVINPSSAKFAAVQFSFGNLECPNTTSMQLDKTRNKLRGRVSSALTKRFNRVKVTVDGMSATKGLYDVRKDSIRRRSISNERFNLACQKLVKSLRSLN